MSRRHAHDGSRRRFPFASAFLLSGGACRKRFVSPPDPESPSTYSFSDEELRLGSEGRRKKYFSVIAGVDPTLALPEAWLHYDQMSAASFLGDVGASSGAIASYHDAFAPDDSLENVSPSP